MLRFRLIPVVAFSLLACGCTSLGELNERVVLLTDRTTETVSLRLIFGSEGAGPGLAWSEALAISMPLSDSSSRRLREIQGAGAHLSAIAGREALVMDVSCPSAEWARVSAVVIEQLKDPGLSDLRIEELRARQHADLDSLRQDPFGLAYAVLWQEHCAGIGTPGAPTGTDAQIEQMTPERLRLDFALIVNRANYVLGLSGPVTSKDAKEFDAALQASLPSGLPMGPAEMCPVPAGLNIRIIELPGVEEATVLMGTVSGFAAGDSGAFVMAMAAVSNGVPGVKFLGMDQFLRIERGLVDGVDIETARVQSTRGGVLARTDDPMRRDCFLVDLQVQPVNALWATRIVIKELTDLNTSGMSTEDITAAARLLTDSNAVAGSVEQKMRTRVAQKWMGIQASSGMEITPRDSRQAIRRAIDGANLWIVAVVPDGQTLQNEVLRGMSSYVYPEWVNRPEMRKLDQEYLAFRPFWEAAKIRVFRAEELFRD